MFGFSRLAGYDYFLHVERALHERFKAAGASCVITVVESSPTGSIRTRARRLAASVEEACAKETGPIHLIGHSTGGLDVRLLLSPAVHLKGHSGPPEWLPRVRTAVTINTPHYGTPLAYFFTTVSGTRLLYALSLLTFATLHFGGPPLTIFSSLVALFGRLDDALGVDVQLLGRATDAMLRVLGDDAQTEVRNWLDEVRKDQGGVIQITPESMDIFNAAVTDAPSVRYGCIASCAPTPNPLRLASKIRSPYAAMSATLYTTLHTMASRISATYPSPEPSAQHAAKLFDGVGRVARPGFNDGIVPMHSMLWGDLLWSGVADHLDIVGHFKGGRASQHTDWLTSGASFSEREFGSAIGALARHLLAND